MASPDGQLRVLFNGEIYNHPEQRAWCEARGARYISDSDTKTLLHLYAIEGKDFVRLCAECSRSRCGTAVNV